MTFPICVLSVPLLAALCLLFLPKAWRLSSMALALGFAAIFFITTLLLVLLEKPTHYQVPWFKLDTLQLSFTYLFNAPAATLLFLLAWIGFWVFLFSAAYLKEDKESSRYFINLSFFTFAMAGLILAGDLWLFFIFWEYVGVGSYLLIAHYREKPRAATAAKKAFMVNRLADLSLFLGIIVAWRHYGTTDLVAMETLLKTGTHEVSVLAGCLIFGGFLGKSAQFPLHVWLPDAMEGPTPVSAFIHAATMVACGVYLLTRVFFLLSGGVLTAVLLGGLFMSLFGGLLAWRQSDIKRVLAYSTLSHLGIMATAVGLGFPNLALMHLFTHAFFKASLFLASGSVTYALGKEQNIYQMGGLFRKMPFTATCFLVASLSLIATPFFAGYYSKHAVITGAWQFSQASALGLLPYALLFLATLLSPLYIGRLFSLVFLGQGRSAAACKAKEAPFFLCLPTGVLAFCSCVAAWFVYGAFKWILPPLAVAAPLEAYQNIFASQASLPPFSLEVGLAVATLILAVYALWRPSFKFLPSEASVDGLGERLLEKCVQPFARAIFFLVESCYLLCILCLIFPIACLARLLARLHTQGFRAYAAWMFLGLLTLLYFVF